MKKIKALYLRKSREVKGEDTFEVMRSRLVRLCEHNKWSYDLYEDIIGGDKEKEDLQRLVSNIEKYDAVVTDAVDRIGRDEEENAEIKKILWLNDVQVITPNKTYDFENESDEMMFGLESLFAKWEHKKIKGRLKKGKVDRFRLGQYTTGKPAIGYRIGADKRLEIYEPEATVIRYIFELSAAGYGAKTILDKLDERSYRTQTGRAFPISHIRSIQKNRHYIGEATMKVFNKRGQLTDTIVIEDAHTPIIDLNTFLRCGEELERRNMNKNHTRSYVKSCLSGLMKCAKCNVRLSIANQSNGRVMVRGCPTCKSDGIKLIHIEQAVVQNLKAHRVDMVQALEVMEGISVEDITKELQQELDAFKNRIKELDIEVDRLTDLALDGLIPKDKLKQRLERNEDESKSVKSKIKHLNHQLAEVSNKTNIELLQQQIAMVDHFEEKELTSQNEFLKGIIDGVLYWRDKIPPEIGRKNKAILDLYPQTIEILYR